MIAQKAVNRLSQTPDCIPPQALLFNHNIISEHKEVTIWKIHYKIPYIGNCCISQSFFT